MSECGTGAADSPLVRNGKPIVLAHGHGHDPLSFVDWSGIECYVDAHRNAPNITHKYPCYFAPVKTLLINTDNPVSM